MMIPSIKIYGNNRILAQQLLETAFSLLRNEGQSPAAIIAIAYDSLAKGVDVSDVDRAAVLAALQDIIEKHSRK